MKVSTKAYLNITLVWRMYFRIVTNRNLLEIGEEMLVTHFKKLFIKRLVI